MLGCLVHKKAIFLECRPFIYRLFRSTENNFLWGHPLYWITKSVQNTVSLSGLPYPVRNVQSDQIYCHLFALMSIHLFIFQLSSKVKPGRAGLVLGWVTAREYAVSGGPFFARLVRIHTTGDVRCVFDVRGALVAKGTQQSLCIRLQRFTNTRNPNWTRRVELEGIYFRWSVFLPVTNYYLLWTSTLPKWTKYALLIPRIPRGHLFVNSALWLNFHNTSHYAFSTEPLPMAIS